ncbi:hypothetical protein GGR55DRAFT_683366 [Xylaria sp. FL0064]|nr:hypothetical protein GGR55DRAFT_684660 [Xylaria sp. FL0064]KAI0798420.1 hypothetical protein GGR55DRAFT_703067 [Xylaria sp. FL0064]KAI0802427.1 hypothetical protein GGR55DRAFT_683366 [Xylaria sp. FL0064]
MTSLGRQPSNGLTSLTSTEVTHCFTIPFGEHFEQVTIQASSFQLHGSPKTFHGCKIQALPCCLISLENEEALRSIWSTCDLMFEVGHWLNITLDRSPASPRCNVDNHVRSSSSLTTRDITTSRPIEAQNISNSHLHPHGKNSTQQQSAKRRRFDSVVTSPINNLESSDLATGARPSVTNCAQEYATKVKRGLLRMKKSKVLKPQHPISFENLGLELLQCRQDAEANDRLINILSRISKDFQSEYWQANFYYRYASYRRRCRDPAHSETMDFDKERHNKDKEALCQVTSLVVNRLEHSWGACANLVFNALKETKYKGCKLYTDITKEERHIVAELIAKELSASTIDFEIPEDMPVINPAVFLSIVTGTPYYSPAMAKDKDRANQPRFSAVCEEVGLGNFAKMDLQSDIDGIISDIETLGLHSGQLPLTALLKRESEPPKGRLLNRRGGRLRIHVSAAENGIAGADTPRVPGAPGQNRMDMLLEAAQTAGAGHIDNEVPLQPDEDHQDGEEWQNWIVDDYLTTNFDNALDTGLGSTISS